MLVRILKMRVRAGRLDDWLRFTRDVGFPGMLAQPGCRAIRRLRGPADDGATLDFAIMTDWDSRADLDRFRASEAMRHLSAAGQGLSVPPAEEILFDVVADPTD